MSPLPPRAAATRNPARTHNTGTPRWRARPAATPPMIGWRVSRVALRTAGDVGAAVVMVHPSSQVGEGRTTRTLPGRTLSHALSGAGAIRGSPDSVRRPGD